MNTNKTIIASLLVSLSLFTGSMHGHAGCPSHSSAHAPNVAGGSWLTNNWQGILFGFVVLGPVRHYWDEVGAAAIRDFVKKCKSTDNDEIVYRKKSACSHGCSH